MPAKGINFAEQTNLFRKRQKQKAATKSLLFAIGLVVITAIVYGFFYLNKSKQVKKLAGINNQIQQERNSRDFESLAEMLDVTTRLNFISGISQNQIRWSGFFHEIEGKLLPAVYLEDWEGATYYSLDNGSSSAAVAPVAGNQEEGITISFISPSLNDISKQIVALNQSDKIENITVTDIQLEDVGLKVGMELKLAPAALSRKTYPDLPAPGEEETTEETTSASGLETPAEGAEAETTPTATEATL